MKNIGLLLPFLAFLFASDPVLSRGKVPRLDGPLSDNSGDNLPELTANDPVHEALSPLLASPSDGSQTPGWENSSTEVPFTPEELSSQLTDLQTQETQDTDPLDLPPAVEVVPPPSHSSPALNHRPALAGQLLLEALGIIHGVSGGQ